METEVRAQKPSICYFSNKGHNSGNIKLKGIMTKVKYNI